MIRCSIRDNREPSTKIVHNIIGVFMTGSLVWNPLVLYETIYDARLMRGLLTPGYPGHYLCDCTPNLLRRRAQLNPDTSHSVPSICTSFEVSPAFIHNLALELNLLFQQKPY